ncbi:MAG TPA: ABC transporter permease [Solirubrobacterales bacterium]|nr:ABC transporter permease [Solirubrobacterales bacterium]
MLVYLIKRLMVSIVVLIGIALLSFLIIHLVPGDPAKIQLGVHATPEAVAQLHHEWGLDKSWPAQFWLYLGNIVTFNFGHSTAFSSGVAELIGNRIAPTAILIGYGLLIALVIGVPLAVVAAVRQGGVADNAIRVLTTFTFAMPPFWLGLMLALLLGFELKWFPVSGYETGVGGILRTMTVPALTLGLGLLVIIVRNLRASLVTVLHSEYIEAARARGYGEARVVFKHAMRNSVIGVITILASIFGFMVGLLVLIENVFQIPGAGTLLVQAVSKRDYQLVQSLVFLSGAVVVIVGFMTDVAYAWLDPRIRLAGKS